MLMEKIIEHKTAQFPNNICIIRSLILLLFNFDTNEFPTSLFYFKH